MTKRSSRRKPSNLESAVVTGLSGLVIILIVLIAQLVGVEGLPTENEPSGDQPVVEDSGDTSDIPPGSLVSILGGYTAAGFSFISPIPLIAIMKPIFRDRRWKPGWLLRWMTQPKVLTPPCTN
jgi:hypothetical protein